MPHFAAHAGFSKQFDSQLTQTPQKLAEFLTGLGFGCYGVAALILRMYLVLGCLVDAMAMIIPTVPIIFAVVAALGFDPIWSASSSS